ncbi:hypothetical protein Dimus_020111, partial [Dionaea muscipula]
SKERLQSIPEIDDEVELAEEPEAENDTETQMCDNLEIFGEEGNQTEKDSGSGEHSRQDSTVEASTEEKQDSGDEILLKDMMNEARKELKRK